MNCGRITSGVLWSMPRITPYTSNTGIPKNESVPYVRSASPSPTPTYAGTNACVNGPCSPPGIVLLYISPCRYAVSSQNFSAYGNALLGTGAIRQMDWVHTTVATGTIGK